MTCKGCVFAIPRTAFMHCQNHGLDTTENAVICSEFRHKTQTNGDRIRAMSDEELAVFLELTVPRPWCASPCRQGDVWTAKCELCVLDWLKQEATED